MDSVQENQAHSYLKRMNITSLYGARRKVKVSQIQANVSTQVFITGQQGEAIAGNTNHLISDSEQVQTDRDTHEGGKIITGE